MASKAPSLLSLSLDANALRDLVQTVVAETVAALDADKVKLGERLAYSEAEAAELLGLHQHQLRDERNRGRIGASMIVGKRIRYSRQDLLDYLAANRMEASR